MSCHSDFIGNYGGIVWVYQQHVESAAMWYVWLNLSCSFQIPDRCLCEYVARHPVVKSPLQHADVWWYFNVIGIMSAVSYECVMTVLWLCYECVMNVLWMICVMNVLWMCYECVMDLLWMCYECVMDVLWMCCGCVVDVMDVWGMLWTC